MDVYLKEANFENADLKDVIIQKKDLKNALIKTTETRGIILREETHNLILVIDDDVHISRLYKEEFEEDGYRVFVARTGEEALELFDYMQPDLVTLDILLPDIDGIRLLRQMKEKRPKVPIIMSTAYDYRDDFAVWASEAYVVKSSDLDEMKYFIDMLLLGESKRRRRDDYLGRGL